MDFIATVRRLACLGRILIAREARILALRRDVLAYADPEHGDMIVTWTPAGGDHDPDEVHHVWFHGTARTLDAYIRRHIGDDSFGGPETPTIQPIKAVWPDFDRNPSFDEFDF